MIIVYVIMLMAMLYTAWVIDEKHLRKAKYIWIAIWFVVTILYLCFMKIF